MSQIPIYNRASANLSAISGSEMTVPSYQVNEEGVTECVPIAEKLRFTPRDGKSLELSNIMYGSLPEQLSQIDVCDAQERAEKITTACVRRFGTLAKQREALVKKFNVKEDKI